MWNLTPKYTLVWFMISLLCVASSCHGHEIESNVVVVGSAECAYCAPSNIKPSQAFSGLQVSINCKSEKGELKIRGVGEVDEGGNFKVTLPQEIVKNGNLNEECYAQLHNVSSSSPCPTTQAKIESSKIVLKSVKNGIQSFGPTGSLKISSPGICTSAFLWHYKKKFYKKHFSPVPVYKKPYPPVHIYKKPYPPHPKYEIPPIPVYKKPHPKYEIPPVPIYKKPKYEIPPIPVYKKPHPKYEIPPVPIYKKPKYEIPPVPIYKKPCPPIHPFLKKPFPPIPSFKKEPLPPFPEIPPKYQHP